MKLHASYSINCTDYAKGLCNQMNALVRAGDSVDQASAKLGLSKSSGRRYYNGSYDFNPGYSKTRRKSFTCVRRGACVAI